MAYGDINSYLTTPLGTQFEPMIKTNLGDGGETILRPLGHDEPLEHALPMSTSSFAQFVATDQDRLRLRT